MIPNPHVTLFDGSQGLSQTCFAPVLVPLLILDSVSDSVT
jgi:hypothetical protein